MLSKLCILRENVFSKYFEVMFLCFLENILYFPNYKLAMLKKVYLMCNFMFMKCVSEAAFSAV